MSSHHQSDSANPARRDFVTALAWGTVPTPPHPQIPDADLKRVAVWVLEQ